MQSIRASRPLHRHLTYANVVATISLLVCLSGTAYAAIHLPASSVTSREVRNSSLKGVDLAAGTVTGADIGDSSVTGADIAGSTLSGADVADGTIAVADLAAGSVTSTKLGAGAVGEGALADGSVTTAKLARDLTLTSADGTYTLAVTDAGIVMHGPAGQIELDAGGAFINGNKIALSADTGDLNLSSLGDFDLDIIGNMTTDVDGTTSDQRGPTTQTFTTLTASAAAQMKLVGSTLYLNCPAGGGQQVARVGSFVSGGTTVNNTVAGATVQTGSTSVSAC